MIGEFTSSKENDVKELVIEARRKQCLTFVQIYDRAKLENDFDGFHVHLAENRMEIMKTNMGYINLHLFIIFVLLGKFASSSCLDCLGIWDVVLAKLLSDFKEPFFDFFLYLRF